MNLLHTENYLLSAMLLIGISCTAQTNHNINNNMKEVNMLNIDNKKEGNSQVSFIDKFFVPEKAKAEFLERVSINRKLIKTLNGFIEDHAYERLDETGNLIFITIAVWENEIAVKKAKELVQAEYKKQGFNPEEMFERLHITMDRGLYKESQP